MSARLGKLMVNPDWEARDLANDGVCLVFTFLLVMKDLERSRNGLGSNNCSPINSGDAIPSFCVISSLREPRDGARGRDVANKSGVAS